MEQDWDALRWNEQGLIPAIVQDVQSKQVLMLAYMNRESLAKTLETGYTWFWSRSRQKLWQKGETSGHVQRVRDIRLDCDGDALLVLVEQTGPACHEGTYSCFARQWPTGDTADGTECSDGRSHWPSSAVWSRSLPSGTPSGRPDRIRRICLKKVWTKS